MEFKLEINKRNNSDNELIEDLVSVAKSINKNTVTIAEYEEYGKFHPSTLQRRFGSWFKVLKNAGLEKSRSYINIPEEELFKNIEDVWIKLGRQPKYAEMKTPLSKYAAGTYDKRFGSWGNSLDKFVEYVNQDKVDKPKSSQTSKPITEEHIIKHKTKREISDRLRFKILMRDGFTCKACGKSPMTEIGVELHVDHIIPWSKGGETIPENLVTKCKQCNLGKGNTFDK